MAAYSSAQEYYLHLERRVPLPLGLRLATARISFFPAERTVERPLPMNLALLAAERPTPSFAAVFTRNVFPGAPVIIGRGRLDQAELGAILVNTKVSNVCAPRGIEDAEALCAETAALLGFAAEQVLPSSTGVIGWSLPVQEIRRALPELVRELHPGGLAKFARAIMTTDSYPKAVSRPLGRGIISGAAKGAGMIEPNMATMLGFILTDVSIARDALRGILAEAVEDSFNCISVDSDQSTSDAVYALSTNRLPPVPEDDFRAALLGVCRELCGHIVRNGEGTAHVIEVLVKGAADRAQARAFGKALINSPLVKTAVFGNDPNVGRLIMALGDWAGNSGTPVDPRRVAIGLGDQEIFSNGAFCLGPGVEERLSAYLRSAAQDPAVKGYPQHERSVLVTVDLGLGSQACRVTGSDLSYEYVRENADYRS